MKPSLVVFDMAGTTVADNDAVNKTLQAALDEAGLEVTRESVNAVMGISKLEAIDSLIESAGRHDLKESAEKIYANFLARMTRFYREDSSVKEIDGAVEVFRQLQSAGIFVALNTGFSREIAQTVLTRLGWEWLPSITSDEVERGRPFPEMIRVLMQQFYLNDPALVAKVGDTPADLHEGTNAGCGWVIGVTNGSHTHEELAIAPHTDLIESVREIPRLFGL